MYFLDLPGYGYAKVSRTLKESWGPMIEGYLRNREQLKLAVMLVDSRMPPTESDQMMKEWLDDHRIPNAVVLTKTDKLSNNQLNHALRLGAQTLNAKEIIAFSTVTGAGREEILARISAATISDPTVRKTHL
jgi:GTP-binding protein